MAVSVVLGPNVSVGIPRPLFRLTTAQTLWEVHPDQLVPLHV